MLRTLDIADALVTDLNAETWALTFTATRALVVEFALEDLGTLHVTVAPIGAGLQYDTRGDLTRVVTLTVGIQQRFDATPGTADALVALGEAIQEHYLHTRLTSGGLTAVCNETEMVTIADPALYRRGLTYTGIVQMTFETEA